MSHPDELPVPLHVLDPELPPPAYARSGDAGADLRTTVDLTLAPGERALVPTGVAIAVLAIGGLFLKDSSRGADARRDDQAPRTPSGR